MDETAPAASDRTDHPHPGGLVQERPARAARTACTAGVASIVAGLAGAAFAVLLLVVPPQVPADRFSFPLAAGPFTAGQILLCLHHLVVATGVLAVLRTTAAGTGRLGRVGGVLGAVALVALGGFELADIAGADVAGETPQLDLVSAGFGIASILMGVGLLLLGIAVVRAHRWTGWRRWLLVVMGVYVFVPLTPAAIGPMLPRLLALAVWSLLFTALGRALLTEAAARARR